MKLFQTKILLSVNSLIIFFIFFISSIILSFFVSSLLRHIVYKVYMINITKIYGCISNFILKKERKTFFLLLKGTVAKITSGTKPKLIK